MNGDRRPRLASLVRVTLALGLCGLAGSAHAAEGMQYNGRFSPKYPEAAKLQAIAVLPFTGTDGGDFAEALSAELRSAVLDGHPYFSIRTLDGLIVPGTRRPAPSKGRKGRAPAAASDETIDAGFQSEAIARGRQLNVDAIYMGRVTIQNISEEKSNKTNMLCLKQTSFLKCGNSQMVNVPCSTVSVEFSVVPKAIRVRDGEVLYSETISRHAEYSHCDDAAPGVGGINLQAIFGGKKNDDSSGTPSAPKTRAGLLLKVRADAAAEIRRAVAPYNKTITVIFKRRAPELPKGTQVDFQNAVAFADAARLDRACPMFTKLLTASTTNSVNLLYNLGVCQEALEPDAPLKALKYYQQADGLLSKPDKLVSDGIRRAQSMVGQSASIDSDMETQKTNKRARKK